MLQTVAPRENGCCGDNGKQEPKGETSGGSDSGVKVGGQLPGRAGPGRGGLRVLKSNAENRTSTSNLVCWTPHPSVLCFVVCS